MSEIIIKGNFSVEGMGENLSQPLKYLKLSYHPIKVNVEEFEAVKKVEELATDLQIKTLLNLGIDLPVKLTKLEASVLIKEALEKKEEMKLPESVQDDKMTPNLEHNDLYNEEGKYL